MKSPAWGMTNVPDTAVAAWGARTIFKSGVIDIVYDRQESSFEDDDARNKFAVWMDAKGFPLLHKAAKAIPSNENKVHAIDDGPFHIRFNAQGSHGYLYVTAWMDKEE